MVTNYTFEPVIKQEEDERHIRAIISTDELDLVGQKATHQFLESLAELCKGRPITTDHRTKEVDNIIGEIIDAELITKDNNKGFNFKGTEAVLAEFKIICDWALNKIDDNLYKWVSCNFKPIEKTKDGITYLTECLAFNEVSFVTVPCVTSARIVEKSYDGGVEMTLEEALKKIDELSTENQTLKETVKSFEDAENQRVFDAKLAEVLDKADDISKEFISDEITKGCKDGSDVDAVIEAIVDKYTKLGHIAGEEETEEVKEKTEEVKEEPEEKEEESEEVKEEIEEVKEESEEKEESTVVDNEVKSFNMNFTNSGNFSTHKEVEQNIKSYNGNNRNFTFY